MEEHVGLPSPSPSVGENPAKRKLYEDFVEMYVAANPHKKRKDSYREGAELWDEMKNDMNSVQKKIKKMAKAAAKKKRKSEVLRNDGLADTNRISSDEGGDSDEESDEGGGDSMDGQSNLADLHVGRGVRGHRGSMGGDMSQGGSNNGHIMDDGNESMQSGLDGSQSDTLEDLLFQGDPEDNEPLEDQLSYLKPTRPTPAQTKVLEELSITTERDSSKLTEYTRFLYHTSE